MRYILFLIAPLALFANSGSSDVGYDIIERTVNFLIFFGILYYLIGEKAKEFYNARINSIADELDVVQSDLKSSEQKKEAAKQKIQQAKDDAKSFLTTSKKEAQILVSKMNEHLQSDMDVLEKTHKEQMLIESRKIKREVISEVLDEMFDGTTLTFDKNEFVDIILKKVA